jgi:hypothetical protein
MINITASNVSSILLGNFCIRDEEDFFDPLLKRKVMISSIVEFLEEKGIHYQIGESAFVPALFVNYKNTLFKVEIYEWYCRIDGFNVIKGDLPDEPVDLTRLKDEYNNRISRKER